MRNILILAGGGDSDQTVFATALSVAQPLGAHLELFPHLSRSRRGGIMATTCRVRARLGDAGDDAAPGERMRYVHRRCEG
jgi:hypothetical protein